MKGPNLLLSGPNYGPKFNFIGHKKKLWVVTNLFLRVENVYNKVWGAKMIRLFKNFQII